MKNNMYDENGLLRPEYAAPDIEKQIKYVNKPNIEKIINTDKADKVDIRTDFGKGYGYRSADGHHYASMKDVEIANKSYYDRMMANNPHYAELEKAFFDCITQTFDIFDCITPTFDINDKDILQQILTTQQERIATYINERYGSYLSKLLEQYDYDLQDNNRSQKR